MLSPFGPLEALTRDDIAGHVWDVFRLLLSLIW